LCVLHPQDPTGYIKFAFKCVLTAATGADSGQHTLNDLLSLGYYPTEQNWMLIDFKTGSQIHKSCVPDLKIRGGESCTYIVGSVQCAPLSKQILGAIKQFGAPQWPSFWEDLVFTKKPRVEQSGKDKLLPVWTPATSEASLKYDSD